MPSAPSNLKAYVIWGSNISLGFTPGNSGRAVIHYYLIEYNNDTAYHKNPKAAVWRLIKNLTKILENPVNITHLKPSTTYRFRMKAFNRVGPSPLSNISEDITTSEGGKSNIMFLKFCILQISMILVETNLVECLFNFILIEGGGGMSDSEDIDDKPLGYI